jgi:hypothetical protein
LIAKAAPAMPPTIGDRRIVGALDPAVIVKPAT